LIGGVVKYKKEKIDKGEHRLRGSITSEGTRKDHFCHFCKKERRKIRREVQGVSINKYQLITKLVLDQLVSILN
jgi:hypothetical protein